MKYNDYNVKASTLCNYHNGLGDRHIVLQLSCHRFILAEINTHKIINKNWRSSRAVPTKVLLKEVRENTAFPVVWLSNQPGMQGGEFLSDEDQQKAKEIWLEAAKCAADYAEKLDTEIKLHKSWVNRLIEPYLYVHGIISGTEFDNLFNLRLKQTTGGAQPEFVALASVMWPLLAEPSKLLKPGQWCLPYISDEDMVNIDTAENRIKISAARLARSSYKQFDGSVSYGKDIQLADNLINNGPHFSPFEHICMPDYKLHGKWVNSHLHGTLNGFIQCRRIIELYGWNGLNQYITNFERGWGATNVEQFLLKL